MFGGNNGNERIEEERQLHEIDENGEYKNKNGNGNSGGGMDTSGDGGGGWGGVKLVAILMCLGIIFAVFFGEYDIRELTGSVNATPQEHVSSMLTSMKRVNKNFQNEGNVHPIYDKNSLFSEDDILSVGQSKYIVYAYKYNEEDNPYNAWVEANESELPIYRAPKEVVDSTGYIYEFTNNSEDTPYFLFISSGRGYNYVTHVALSTEEASENIEKLKSLSSILEEEK